MSLPEQPFVNLPRAVLHQMLNDPVEFAPLSSKLARVMVEHCGARAHPETMVRLTSDEIWHLTKVAHHADMLLLGFRASAPGRHELVVLPALEADTRFARVALAGRAQSTFVPEVRQLMLELLREPTPPRPPARHNR